MDIVLSTVNSFVADMKSSYTFPLINHHAIQSIVNRQVNENYAEPIPKNSLVYEERLSAMNYFSELAVVGKCTRPEHPRNHIARYHGKKSSELQLNEECIDKRSGSAFNAKFSLMDENFLSLESEILEEDELSSLNHVVEKIIDDMTLESEIECHPPKKNKGMRLQESVSRELYLEKNCQLDSTKLSFPVTSSVNMHNAQLNYVDVHMVLSGSHSTTRETTRKGISYEFEGTGLPSPPKDLKDFSEKLKRTSICSLEQEKKTNVPQKNLVREATEIHTPDHDKEFLANTERKMEQSQERKSYKLSSSPILQSNISPPLKVLRKQRSESHIIAYDTYEPCNVVSQQGLLQACCPLASKSQETNDLRIDFMDISEKGFSTGNTSSSVTHLEIKSKKISKRRKNLNLTIPNQPLEKNKSSTCIVSKVRKKELLDGKDWQCLQEAGTSWKSGVRRSLRIGSRPLTAPNQTLEKNKVPKVRKKELLNCEDWQYLQEDGASWTSGVRRSLRIRSRPLTSLNQTCENNNISTCIVPKVQKKELLNCEDWQYLQEAGTLWQSGVRRSSRIRSRPLEFWRGERFLYGRVLDCLTTVIGIKYTSPGSVATGKGKTTEFKVESFVDEKYSDAVNFAALY